MQLLILAVTDIAVSLFWALGFVLVENNLLSVSKNLHFFIVFGYSGYFIMFMNRFLTIYIAFNRARVVWSLAQALQSLRKTEKDHIQDIILIWLFPSLLVGIAMIICFAAVGFEDPVVQAITGIGKKFLFEANILRFIFHLFNFVVMALLASYILWKMRSIRLDAATKVMQKNVASVAVVFCICLMPGMIRFGELAFLSDNRKTIFQTKVVTFFLVLNSGVNIFIYIALGKNFRMILFNVFTGCWQRRGRRGEIGGNQATYRKFSTSSLTDIRVISKTGRTDGIVGETSL
jgi:hypothetical protein